MKRYFTFKIVLIILVLFTMYCSKSEKDEYEYVTETNIIPQYCGVYQGDFPKLVEDANVVVDEGILEIADTKTFRWTTRQFSNYYISGTYITSENGINFFPLLVKSFDNNYEMNHPAEVWKWKDIYFDNQKLIFNDIDLDKNIELTKVTSFPTTNTLQDANSSHHTIECNLNGINEIVGSSVLIEIEMISVYAISERPRYVYIIDKAIDNSMIISNFTVPNEYFWAMSSITIKPYFYVLPNNQYVSLRNSFGDGTYFGYPYNNNFKVISTNSSMKFTSSLYLPIRNLTLSGFESSSVFSFNIDENAIGYYIHFFGAGFNGCELVKNYNYDGSGITCGTSIMNDLVLMKKR